jgi:uncharacterized membrane protein YraQ (UPF0718 family)
MQPRCARPSRRWRRRWRADNADVDRILLLIAGAVLALFAPGLELGPWHAQVAVFLHGLLLEAFPWLLLGALVAAAAEELLPDGLLPGLARRLGPWAVPGTALAAPFMPMCECGIVVVVRGLIAKGLPAHLCITFLLAAPILNPIVLATTWMAFQDWRLVVLRGACGFAIACLAGALASRAGAGRLLCSPPAPSLAGVRISLAGARPYVPERTAPVASAILATAARRRGDLLRGIARRSLGHALDIAAIFVAGAFLAAIAKASIPAELIATVGGGTFSGPLLGAGLAICLSICAETDAFLAATFTGMAPAAILCFLVVGPMLDLKLLLMYRGVFTGRTVLHLAVGIPLAAIALSLLAGAAW